jgi:acyl-CoA-dependent ceramide synthase
MSMDIPDTFLAVSWLRIQGSHKSTPIILQFSKLLNYIQWNTAKVYAFGVFFGVWTLVSSSFYAFTNPHATTADISGII